MLVPTTTSVAVGQKLTASFWNAQVKAAVDFLLAPPLAYAYQATTGTTFVTAVGQVVLLDGEQTDNDTMHDPTTNSSRIFATTAGRYEFAGELTYPANVTGTRQAAVRLNAAAAFAGGTQLDNTGTQGANASGSTILKVFGWVTMAAGDYIEMFGLQTSGGNLTSTIGPNSTWLTLVRHAS